MTHLICRIREFEIVAPYTLRIDFDDGTKQVVDLLPVVHGELYGPLRDLVVFNKVEIDSDIRTLVWPNGADFDPATLRDWPSSGAAFADMAQSWNCAK